MEKRPTRNPRQVHAYIHVELKRRRSAVHHLSWRMCGTFNFGMISQNPKVFQRMKRGKSPYFSRRYSISDAGTPTNMAGRICSDRGIHPACNQPLVFVIKSIYLEHGFPLPAIYGCVGVNPYSVKEAMDKMPTSLALLMKCRCTQLTLIGD